MLRFCFGGVLLFLITNLVQAKDGVPANLIAGKKIAANAKLKKGDKVVGWFENKAYLVEILEVKSNNKLRIVWVESNIEADDVRPNDLYEFGDSSQLRKSRTSALPETFRSLDKNGDGQIALSEWDRKKYAEFKRLDKNHDGFLTPKELSAKGATTTTTTETASAATTKETEVKSAPAAVSKTE